MLRKLAKRSDETLIRLVKLSNKGANAILVVEKTTGMPKHFNSPKPILPKIQFK